MAGAAFASFGAVQYNYVGNPGSILKQSDGMYFTFDANTSLFAPTFVDGAQHQKTHNVVAFGYYFLDNPANLIAGDFSTGHLGNFKAGDMIGYWVQSTGIDNINAGIYTTTKTGIDEHVFYNGFYNGKFYFIGLRSDSIGNYAAGFIFVEGTPPAGEPLPGVIAALAIGGCAFLGMKLKNRVKG